MAYERFLESNDTHEKRIEALLSIVSPDPKGIILWSMEQGRPYISSGAESLYLAATEFSGWLPVTRSSSWAYCDGLPSQGYEGSLHKIGAVVDVRETLYPWGREERAYLSTDAGEDFGKPTVALGTRLVNELYGKTEDASMWRLLGACNSTGKTRRMFVVYRVVEELIKSGKPLRRNDIAERTGLSNNVVGLVLNSLGYSNKRSGIIDYDSPFRDIQGKLAKRWAIYRTTKKIQDADPEDVYEQARSLIEGFSNKSYLVSTFNFIKQNPDKEFTGEETSENLSMRITHASSCLSILAKLGYLESTFKGGETQSQASANQYTLILWRTFLEPIGIVANTMDPTLPEFTSTINHYSSHDQERESAIRRQMEIYNAEKSSIGPKGGEILDQLIFSSLTVEPKKASQIIGEVNSISERRLTRSPINARLKEMAKGGMIQQFGRGYYGLAPSEN